MNSSSQTYMKWPLGRVLAISKGDIADATLCFFLRRLRLIEESIAVGKSAQKIYSTHTLCDNVATRLSSLEFSN